MWQPLLDRLADTFHLVAPDYPGFGHSDGSAAEARREFWADRQTHEAALRENFFSFAATRQRHVGTSPNAENLRHGPVDR